MSTRLRHHKAAVVAGEWLWDPIAKQLRNGLSWWDDVETRPYMRAVHALGLAYRENGENPECRACFERLLAMNPYDNQGIRCVVDEIDGDSGAPRFR